MKGVIQARHLEMFQPVRVLQPPIFRINEMFKSLPRTHVTSMRLMLAQPNLTNERSSKILVDTTKQSILKMNKLHMLH